MAEKKFLMYNSILKEFRCFETNVNYEKIFNELDEDIKSDLELLTEYYYIDLIGQNTLTNFVNLQCIKNISTLPVRFNIYYIKDYKLFSIQTEPGCKKIGLSIYLPSKEILNLNEEDGMLQNINFIMKNDITIDEFKNYIYNILFYAHIIVKNFIYNPILKYIYHYDDIENLIDLKNIHIKLFGEHNECSLCLEGTIGKTICNHNLCQKCYCKLQTKKCPMCRTLLCDENEIYESVTTQFFIN